MYRVLLFLSLPDTVLPFSFPGQIQLEQRRREEDNISKGARPSLRDPSRIDREMVMRQSQVLPLVG